MAFLFLTLWYFLEPRHFHGYKALAWETIGRLWSYLQLHTAFYYHPSSDMTKVMLKRLYRFSHPFVILNVTFSSHCKIENYITEILLKWTQSARHPFIYLALAQNILDLHFYFLTFFFFFFTKPRFFLEPINSYCWSILPYESAIITAQIQVYTDRIKCRNITLYVVKISLDIPYVEMG